VKCPTKATWRPRSAPRAALRGFDAEIDYESVDPRHIAVYGLSKRQGKE